MTSPAVAYLVVRKSPVPIELDGAIPPAGTPPTVGAIFTLSAGTVVMGREAAPDVAIVLPYPQVSRRQAQIHGDGQGNWEIQDLSSRNGTLHNGQRLPSNALAPLRDGDHIQPADATEFLFTFVPPPPPLAPSETYERELADDEFPWKRDGVDRTK